MAAANLLVCNRTQITVLTSMRKCQILVFLCVLVLPLLNIWHKSLPFDSKQPKGVTILMWHRPFGQPIHQTHRNWIYKCARGCTLVENRSMFSTADVVVFHNAEIVSGQVKLPMDLPRPPGQKWAWMSLESPVHNGNLKQFAGIFNLTISYRRDADISTPYGERIAKEPDAEHPEQIMLQNKTFLACWVVSNYRKYYRRSKVYQELQSIVPVKVYGKWTNTPLSREALLPTISRCTFYLAFENSEAKDYITEKLWLNAYQSGALPVVLGAPVQDYEAVAPPGSFIHVDQFASIKELAEYMVQLAKDQKRYSQYFLWKQKWNVKSSAGWSERLCMICSHFEKLPSKKVYTNLAEWVDDTGPGTL